MIAHGLPTLRTEPTFEATCATPPSMELSPVAERRGRKRAPPIDISDYASPEERKRLIRLAKNRKAAEQCRERRRQEYADMCDKLKASQQTCFELRRRLDIAQAELATLKHSHHAAMDTLRNQQFQQQQLMMGLVSVLPPTSPATASSPATSTPTTFAEQAESDGCAMPEQPSNTVSTLPLHNILAALLATNAP